MISVVKPKKHIKIRSFRERVTRLFTSLSDARGSDVRKLRLLAKVWELETLKDELFSPR